MSLNKCFKKVPRSEGRGKGGYWIVDPEYKAKFRNGTFINTTPSPQRSQPQRIRAKDEQHETNDEEVANMDVDPIPLPPSKIVACEPHHHHPPPPPPVFVSSEYNEQHKLNYTLTCSYIPRKECDYPSQQSSFFASSLSSIPSPLSSSSTSCASTTSSISFAPPPIPPPPSSTSSPSQIMQIHNLLN